MCTAVSGGADSVAMLRLLSALADELGITLLVAHLNHSLRGAESDGDAEFVRYLAQTHNLKFLQRVEDVAAAAERNGWNLEDAGRRLRRKFFDELVSEGSADRIAVAHTADDQAETLLAHLFRGTGITGLGGIHPVDGPVVRPLLEIRRQELRDYLYTLNQEWREDATNQDTTRTRARIRKNLLPQIERDYSPAVVGHLNDLARLAREEETFWGAFIEERFRKLTHETAVGLSISAADLLAPLPIETAATRSVSERLVRRIFEALQGDRRELSAKHVEQVLLLAGSSQSGLTTELPRGILVRSDLGQLVFSRRAAVTTRTASHETTGQANPYQYEVTLPLTAKVTVAVVEVGKRLSLNLIDWPTPERDTIWDNQALDADLLRAPLILRNWRPGDSYRPRGRRNEQKLKQMMLGKRVPAAQRTGWPVLESAGQVVWALGMVPAGECAAGAKTQKALWIAEEQG
ncbi:MAG TPA: tRNA lysidine(34) synthetase TilS [Candidatus Acidoferrales bacterium]